MSKWREPQGLFAEVYRHNLVNKEVALGSNYQKFAKDVSIIGSAKVLIALKGIVFLPLLTKTLGAKDYGIWSQVSVLASLAVGLVGLGLPFAMTRFLPAMTSKEEIQDDFWSVFCTVFLAAAVLSLVIIANASFIADAFFEGETSIVRITGIIILVESLDGVLLSFYRSFRQMIRHSFFTIASAYFQLGLIAYLVLSGHGILGIIVAVLVIKVFLFIVLFILIQAQVGIRRPHFFRIREYLHFGLPTTPGNVFAFVVGSSDKYVIAYFLGSASVGIYSAGYVLGSIPFMLAAVLGFVLPPALSKSYDEGNLGEVKKHLSYSLKYYLAVTIPFFFGSIVLSKPVLSLFSTPEMANDGYFVIPIVALGILFYGAYAVVGQILVVTKKTKIIGLIWIIAGVVNLGLNIVVVPFLGIVGAALTTLFAYLLAFIMGSYYSFREFKFDMDWRFVLKSTIASLVMAFIICQINPSSGLATIVTVVIGVSIYAVFILLLRGFKKEEFIFLRGLLRRAIQ